MKALMLLLAGLVGDYPSETQLTSAHYKQWFGPSAIDGHQNDDGTFTDILSDEYAVEVDWAAGKWKESLSQATLYAIHNKRKPAVMLLIKDIHKDKDDLLRCLLVCQYHDVPVFTHRVENESLVSDRKFEEILRSIRSGDRVVRKHSKSEASDGRYLIVNDAGDGLVGDVYFVSGSQYLEAIKVNSERVGEAVE